MEEFAVNGRFLGLPYSGVNRYAREVWARLPKSQARAIEPRARLSSWRALVWEQTALPMRMHKEEVLLSLTNLGPLSVHRQVLVVHDVAPLDHPEWFPVGFRKAFAVVLPLLAKRVAACVTDSEFSRQRMVEKLGLDAGSVTCIYPGCGSQFYNPNKNQVKEPYVLAYGVDDPRKNLGRLLEAWTKVRREVPGYTLKLFGSNRFWADMYGEDLEGVEHLGYVSDADLPTLYQKASLLVYPSLYEGFGLPIIESLASGTPVVASNIDVFRELFDTMVTLVNPFETRSIADGIIEVLSDTTSDRNGHTAEVMARYNYDRTTQQLLDLVARTQGV
jgi:glycosyltransferase involved in cell wall biosynthesis